MSKQDGYASRTPADLERKYKFGETFAEVFGLVSDARKIAEEAQSAIEGLDQEQIFNLLTNNGKAQGIYRDDKGDVYVNASYIKSGKLAAEYIDAASLKVSAANITGTLTIGQLPGTVAETSDIPTKTSQLTNNSGFVDSNSVTEITHNAIKTANIYADQIEAGGTINGCKLTTSQGVAGNIVIDQTYITMGDNYVEMMLGSGGLFGIFNNRGGIELSYRDRFRIYDDDLGNYWQLHPWGLAYYDGDTGEQIRYISAENV
jgi:hypothetical protein